MFYVAGYRGTWITEVWIRLMWIVMKMTWADLNLLEIGEVERNLLEIGDAKLLGWAKAILVL